jgi:hypothetical protein
MPRGLNRRSVLRSCLVILLVATTGATAATQQDDQKSKTIVGSWWTNVRPTVLPPFLGLGTFTADGGVINTTSLSLSTPLESPGHGRWVQTGPRTFAITFATLSADSAGTLLWTSKVRARVRLTQSGDEFTGEFTVELFEPNGSLIASDSGTVHSTRINVEPL